MKRPTDPFLVIVDPSIGRTGAFVCAQHMACALRGHMPALLVVPREAHFSPDDLNPFVRCERLALRAQSRVLPAALAWLAALIPSGVRLRMLLARTKATHLVLNDFYLLQGVICRLLGFRGQIITWVRVEPQRAGGKFTEALCSLIGFSSNRVVAVSCFVQRQIPAWLNASVIYDCLSSGPQVDAKPVRFGRLVYLGHLMPGKGQDHAIEAFAAIADRFPEAVLEFHGGTLGIESNINWQQGLKRKCTQLGLEHRISFHGEYSRPFEALKDAFAALNFSESESFSMTVLEALRAGVPVIATDSGGPAEIIANQRTGILVPTADIGAMSRAIASLLLNPSTALAMSRNAMKDTTQRFSESSYQANLLRLFNI